MAAEYFAQRVLNPFRGCLQIIRFEAAEAVSMDGLRWDIYVSNDSLLEGLEEATGPVQISEIRYGRWTAGEGLKRGPMYPSEDFYRMERMGMVVYEALRHLHDRVPFPFRDRFERWLLDREGRPLVLLDSAVGEGEIAPADDARWNVGLACRERFVSPAGRGGDLMDYVNSLGGEAVWFRREADGRGVPLAGDAAGTLPDDAFPPLLLRTDGHDAGHARLVEDFLAWQAPWLLLLPLDPATRARLETLARARGDEVERQHRLYPATVDPAQIQAARVEAMLTRRLAATQDGDDTDLSTFYIELNPAGDE